MTSLATAGYRTHAVGKPHFKGRHYGFARIERMEETSDCIIDDDYLMYLRANGVTTRFQHGSRDLLYFQPQTLPTPLEHSPNEWVANRTIAFLRDHQRYRSHRPFFLWSSYVSPHPPFAACEPMRRCTTPRTSISRSTPNGRCRNCLTAPSRTADGLTSPTTIPIACAASRRFISASSPMSIIASAARSTSSTILAWPMTPSSSSPPITAR